MRSSLILCVAGLAISAATVQGHHSIAAAYDSAKTVTIDGTISQLQFVNPHPFLLTDVRDARGNVQSWRLEMDNRHELIDVGFTAATLKPGDRVVVTGSPAYREPRSLYIRKLERPADGFQYEQVGSSPRIRVPAR